MVTAHAEKQRQLQPQAAAAAMAPTAFVCQDYACKAPTTDPLKLLSLLREAGAPVAKAGPGAAAKLSEMAWPPPPAAKPGGGTGGGQ
jgi:hypothetical protein